MLRQQRESEIVRLLADAEQGMLTVVELSSFLRVSEMTIRRDLQHLQQRGLVQRVHGGAMCVGSALVIEKSFNDRGGESRAEKVAIGRAAAAHVVDGDFVILDAGTTTTQIARHLQGRHVTAVTNALPVATELAAHPGVTAVLLGGTLKRPELCTIGPITTDSLASMAADRLFLSCTGFCIERGLTDPDMREAEVKRAMIRASREVVLVADSSKYSHISFAHIAPLESVGLLITDAGLPRCAREAIEERGIRVAVADTANGRER